MTAGMLTEPQLDPMGALILELRADADVAALVDTRVRGYQPAPGDALGPGEYRPFVVLQALTVMPHARVPVTWAEYAVRTYGATPQGAWAVWGAVVKALHEVGHRTTTAGQLFYKSIIVSGGTQDEDPDTHQPLVTGSVQLIASLQSVSIGS